jgi:hypothetical protein
MSLETIKNNKNVLMGTGVVGVILYILLQFGLVGSNSQFEKIGKDMVDNKISAESRFSRLETKYDYLEKQVAEITRLIEKNHSEIKADLKEIKSDLKGK